jgi:hypothetical protein
VVKRETREKQGLNNFVYQWLFEKAAFSATRSAGSVSFLYKQGFCREAAPPLPTVYHPLRGF